MEQILDTRQQLGHTGRFAGEKGKAAQPSLPLKSILNVLVGGRGEGRDEGKGAGEEQGCGRGRGNQSKHNPAPGSLAEGLKTDSKGVQHFLPGCLCELLTESTMPGGKKFVLISSFPRGPGAVKW